MKLEVSRRTILASSAAFLLKSSGNVFAQTFPSKAITLVVPFAPGGTTDILARIIGQLLSAELGFPVIIENKGGAGGNIGAAAVAQATADGHTLLMGYNGTNAINPSLYPTIPWNPATSFDAIGMVARVNNAVVVHPSLPVHSYADLVAYAKANPGKLTYGSAGAGSIFHLGGVLFELSTGTKLTHLAYRGAAPALNDLVGGHIQLMFTTIPTALSLIKGGKIRAIGVTGEQRSPLFPDLPTAKESGLTELVIDSWFGVFAPAKLPVAVRTKLETVLASVLRSEIIKQKFEEQGAVPTPLTGAELAKVVEADLKTWKSVIDRTGIKVE